MKYFLLIMLCACTNTNKHNEPVKVVAFEFTEKSYLDGKVIYHTSNGDEFVDAFGKYLVTETYK